MNFETMFLILLTIKVMSSPFLYSRKVAAPRVSVSFISIHTIDSENGKEDQKRLKKPNGNEIFCVPLCTMRWNLSLINAEIVASHSEDLPMVYLV